MLRLLLIEPSATVAIPIQALLEQNQFTVDVIETIAEARACDLTRYALLVIDVHRDNREALDFVQWLHRKESHLLGRVVVMSAGDADALTRELDALGVCDVVPKPINAEEIVRAVFECLEKNPIQSVQ